MATKSFAPRRLGTSMDDITGLEESPPRNDRALTRSLSLDDDEPSQPSTPPKPLGTTHATTKFFIQAVDTKKMSEDSRNPLKEKASNNSGVEVRNESDGKNNFLARKRAAEAAIGVKVSALPAEVRAAAIAQAAKDRKVAERAAAIKAARRVKPKALVEDEMDQVTEQFREVAIPFECDVSCELTFGDAEPSSTSCDGSAGASGAFGGIRILVVRVSPTGTCWAAGVREGDELVRTRGLCTWFKKASAKCKGSTALSRALVSKRRAAKFMMQLLQSYNNSTVSFAQCAAQQFDERLL